MTKKYIYLLFALVVTTIGCQKQDVEIPTTTEGRLNGLFSVSAQQQVYFSKGNLQYLACDKLFRFAEKQYDIAGEKPNLYISRDSQDWIDLFGWGTGKNPAAFGFVYFFYDVFNDWGARPIINGGNKANIWHTLSFEEWEYLLYERKQADQKLGVAIIDTIYSFVLLPDEWQCPEDVIFISGMDESPQLYLPEQWKLMEQAGAVALPAAGMRIWGYNKDYEDLKVFLISSINKEGNYWTSTVPDSQKYGIAFSFSEFDDEMYMDTVQRQHGYSVRVVQYATNK